MSTSLCLFICLSLLCPSQDCFWAPLGALQTVLQTAPTHPPCSRLRRQGTACNLPGCLLQAFPARKAAQAGKDCVLAPAWNAGRAEGEEGGSHPPPMWLLGVSCPGGCWEVGGVDSSVHPCCWAFQAGARMQPSPVSAAFLEGKQGRSQPGELKSVPCLQRLLQSLGPFYETFDKSSSSVLEWVTLHYWRYEHSHTCTAGG